MRSTRRTTVTVEPTRITASASVITCPARAADGIAAASNAPPVSTAIRCDLELRRAERSAEHADERCEQGHHGTGPAECRVPSTHRESVAGAHEDHRVGDPVGHVVVERAHRRGPTVLHRDHAVEHVAEQAQLDPERRDDQPGAPARAGRRQECATGDDGEHRAQHGNRIRREPGAGHCGGQRAGPAGLARCNGSPFGHAPLWPSRGIVRCAARGCRRRQGDDPARHAVRRRLPSVPRRARTSACAPSPDAPGGPRPRPFARPCAT